MTVGGEVHVEPHYVLVTGGRPETMLSVERIRAALDRLHAEFPITTLIHGAARGTDTACAEWARDHRLEVLGYPARWSEQGGQAGFIRNEEMARLARSYQQGGRRVTALVFPGGRGTAHMERVMKAAGLHGRKVLR